MQLWLWLSQFYYLFIPKLAEQLIWGCFVNSQGGLGRGIPADLHMEYLNRWGKEAVTNLDNKIPALISKMGKAVGKKANLMVTFDEMFNLPTRSSVHTAYSDE